ncbi:probable disease resistance protein At4g14610 [Ziziphus jujuba]|uniref:NB-ARC domain-containing protein n=2 Tax=Ziziphus jujuba TaxID=326968 RepID=A0A978W3H0_ZIZJJ|nr:probable disease resistance protein At4g14610 [Ziziphus jujuba]KAH7546504.1 hypothetical protein FEM48_Zijuj01G0207800 [Ziziphus jujuba var. spinosa]
MRAQKLEELNSRKDDKESRMRAELLPGKRPKKEAQLWLARVEKINSEILTIQQELRGKHLSRACLGKTLPHSGDRLPMPNTFLVGQATFNKKIEEIWTCLMDDGVRKIGVYGMGWIGKTTAAKTINNRLLTEKDKFENVIWVTVPDPSSIFKLQDAIACKLKLDLSEEYGDETTRAAKLCAELSKRRRYVIIPDDLWEAYHLEDVGIPEPSLENGCKLVLTTRSYDVSRRMHCKSIKMELLSKDETLKLFLDKVGHDVLCVPNLKAIMPKVAEECACLPLPIIAVAGILSGIVDSEWKIALEELKMFQNGLMGREVLCLRS